MTDAELLKDCEHRLTQLVIKDELRSGRSDNIVIDICKTLREVAASLETQGSDR